MHPAIRTQVDDLFDLYSIETGLDASGDTPITRQEFKDETDINTILDKFGIDSFNKQPTFGEINFDTDLQTAMEAVSASQRAWNRLPEDLKEKYPTWQDLLTAIRDGNLDLALEEEPIVTPPTPPET